MPWRGCSRPGIPGASCWVSWLPSPSSALRLVGPTRKRLRPGAGAAAASGNTNTARDAAARRSTRSVSLIPSPRPARARADRSRTTARRRWTVDRATAVSARSARCVTPPPASASQTRQPLARPAERASAVWMASASATPRVARTDAAVATGLVTLTMLPRAVRAVGPVRPAATRLRSALPAPAASWPEARRRAARPAAPG